MRRFLLPLAAALTFAAVAPAPVRAQALPPHAWLFGTWTGGLFPVASGITPAACLAQPVVIFTKDLVLRATLTDQTLTQRVIESVRSGAAGAEFRFAQTLAPPSGSGLLGLQSPQYAEGFGCENATVLHVERRGENEISFPGCSDFPYPLFRCPAR
jgi:hypothetical protein